MARKYTHTHTSTEQGVHKPAFGPAILVVIVVVAAVSCFLNLSPSRFWILTAFE